MATQRFLLATGLLAASLVIGTVEGSTEGPIRDPENIYVSYSLGYPNFYGFKTVFNANSSIVALVETNALSAYSVVGGSYPPILWSVSLNLSGTVFPSLETNGHQVVAFGDDSPNDFGPVVAKIFDFNSGALIFATNPQRAPYQNGQRPPFAVDETLLYYVEYHDQSLYNATVVGRDLATGREVYRAVISNSSLEEQLGRQGVDTLSQLHLVELQTTSGVIFFSAQTLVTSRILAFSLTQKSFLWNIGEKGFSRTALAASGLFCHGQDTPRCYDALTGARIVGIPSVQSGNTSIYIDSVGAVFVTKDGAVSKHIRSETNSSVYTKRLGPSSAPMPTRAIHSQTATSTRFRA